MSLILNPQFTSLHMLIDAKGNGFSECTQPASNFRASITRSGIENTRQFKVEVSVQTFTSDDYAQGVNSFTRVAAGCMQLEVQGPDKRAIRNKTHKIAQLIDSINPTSNKNYFRHWKNKMQGAKSRPGIKPKKKSITDTQPSQEQANPERHDNNSQPPQPTDAEDEVIESAAQQEDHHSYRDAPAEESCIAAIDGTTSPPEQVNSDFFRANHFY